MDDLRAKLIRQSVGAAIAALTLLQGCREGRASDHSPAAPAVAHTGEGGAPVSLDSALTLFRVGLEPVTELRGGTPSMDALTAALASSLTASDTARLRTLVMTRREFAWLYYPTSRYTRRPTVQEPALAWFLHLQQSQKGVTRLLNRFGGRTLRVISNSCAEARVEGRNRLWHDCIQRAVTGRDTVQMRLIGGIYERNGVYKVLTYANDL